MERVNIDKVYHPFITGAYNKIVGEMMQETGARINVPPPSVNKNEIVITGEKEQVALAVALIKKIHEEKVRWRQQKSDCIEQCLVPVKRYKYLVFVSPAEEEYHHDCSGGEEVSAQVCRRPQGKHPAGDPG